MRRMSGFSLMEMMVVLLITAIVAAASAPMINKKLMHDQAESGSPWLYAGTDKSIVYNVKGSETQTVSIGGVNNTGTAPALYIANTGDSGLYIGRNESYKPHVLLVDNNSGLENANLGIKYQSGGVHITTEKEENVLNGVIIGAGATTIGTNVPQSVANATAIGGNTFASKNSVAVGASASAQADAVAVGASASAQAGAVAIGGYSDDANKKTQAGEKAIAIGTGVNALAVDSVAIGSKSNIKTSGEEAIAIGIESEANGVQSIAIGAYAKAYSDTSIAIGHGVKATRSNQIVLGTADDTVYIPGNLVVDGSVVLARNDRNYTYARIEVTGGGSSEIYPLQYRLDDVGDKKGVTIRVHNKKSTCKFSDTYPLGISSDRRLKDVGKAFVGGLEDVKKLEVFNYTYKKDTTKTPHVGVMAQDLEKIFPNAVFKGDDGFLRIRMEDMFYAVVNAIKELDSKFEALRNNEIKTLQKQVADLEKQNKELLKRIEKIEKNLK